MTRIAIALVLLAACSRESSPPPPPPPAPAVLGGSYSDLVKQTQPNAATETRTGLACAAAIATPPRPAYQPSPGTEAERAKRATYLATLSGTALLAATTDDGEVYDVAIQRLLKSFDEPMTMARAERDLWLWNAYSGEVSNGGHHQYFFNSAGGDATETREGLVRMGVPDALLAIFDCALTAFPGNQPAQNRGERNDQLARWGERQFQIFDRLDSAFFALTASTPAAIGTYLRAHMAEMPNVSKPPT